MRCQSLVTVCSILLIPVFTGCSKLRRALTTPWSLAIHGPKEIQRRQCVSYEVKAYNLKGQLATSSNPIGLKLRGASRGKFFADADCSAEMGEFAIAPETSAVRFYFKDDVSELLLLVADGGGLTPGILPAYVNKKSTGNPGSLDLSF